jgi:ferredoxin
LPTYAFVTETVTSAYVFLQPHRFERSDRLHWNRIVTHRPRAARGPSRVDCYNSRIPNPSQGPQQDRTMPKITFINEKKELEVPAGANLRDEAIKAGIQVNPGLFSKVNCFGHGTCGTCRILVKKGMENLSQKGIMEKFTLLRMFSAIGHEDEMRLACQCSVNGDCAVETKPPMNISGEVFWQKPYPNK